MAGLGAALALAALTPAVAAQDEPAAPIEEDTTWTKADSPVVIPLFVTVEEGVTLTVEPGVRVETRGLRVLGGLRAEGTPEEPVVFTGVEGREWDGITISDVDGDRPASALEDVRIEDAVTALSMRKDAFPVHDVVFLGNRTALRVTNPGTAVSFTGNAFYSNEHAFVGKTTSFIGIYQNDFWDNDVSLLFEAQSPYACGSDPGVFDVRYNDILRGPDDPYFTYDVRTSAESSGSGMVVRAPDNWWGTTDPYDIAARMMTEYSCCPGVPVHWQEPAGSPQTPAEPPGPVASPEPQPSSHGDPAFVAWVESPGHRDCLPKRTVRRIHGSATPAVGDVPRRLRVGFVRIRETSGCESYDPATGRFSTFHACGERRHFMVPIRDGVWQVRLPRPLGSGKYTFAAGGNAVSGTHVVRFRVLRG